MSDTHSEADESARQPNADQALLWLNDRLGHDVEVEVVVKLPDGQVLARLPESASQEIRDSLAASGPHFGPLLRARGELSYWSEKELHEAPYPLDGKYIIGGVHGDLSIGDFLPRATEIMATQERLWLRVAPETSLQVRDLTYLEKVTPQST